MRVAHIDDEPAVEPAECDSARSTVVRQRNVPPVRTQNTHVTGNPFVTGPVAVKHASERFDRDRIRIPFFQQHPRDATCCVSTGANLATVNVEEAHENIGTGGLGRLQNDQLIRSHANLLIADSDDRFDVRPIGNRSRIDNHEMIAQTVHLDERATGWGLRGDWHCPRIMARPP